MEKLVRLRYWWFVLSLVIILPGIYFLFFHSLVTTGTFQFGLHPSIDFSGGALWEMHFPEVAPESETVTTERIRDIFAAQGFEDVRVQLGNVEIQDQTLLAALVRSESLSATDPTAQQEAVLQAIEEEYQTTVRLERLESVGPTVSAESTRSAVVAVLGASVAILLYLTFAFRKAPHPVRYGTCAIIAMLHDLLLILGVASAFGYFFGVEVDALFLTAVLTIISFSVHDTIVVFDRIRENLINQRPGEIFDEVVNHSIVQTLPRSINTQLTTFFTLTALLLFGGATIRNFIAIMLIGLISGTYSSIFNAAQILVVWEHQEWKTWFGRGEKNKSNQTSTASG
jgi:preprotein translocase subunit SecF